MSHPLSVQLYSVRHAAAKDFQGTLNRIKDMGYDGVDFFGSHGTADEVKAALDKANLFCAGWHVTIDQMDTDEKLAETIKFHQTIGNKYLVVPGAGSEYTSTRANWMRFIKRLNEIDAILAPLGMYTGYHNHFWEFQDLEGARAWDLMIENTSKRVIGQLDLGNAARGGVDPIAYLKKYPGRARTIHLKPFSQKDQFEVVIGEDEVDWKRALALCEAEGTEQYIVEFEGEKIGDPMDNIAKCVTALRNFGY